MYFLYTFLLVVAAGIVVRFVAPNIASNYASHSYFRADKDSRKLSWGEILFGSILIAVPVILLAGFVAASVSVNSKLTRHEFYNGYEKAALMQVTTCTRDGSCNHNYDCDPYQVWVDTSYTDSDGNHVSDGHYETEYHSCPYTNKEWAFTVDTSLGAYPIATVLQENPESHKWRSSKSIPSHLVRSSGYPAKWLAAKERLDAGHPGPVTQVHEYKNYILASDSTILAKYSSQIDDYRKAKLMPSPASGTHSLYRSDKFHMMKGVDGDTKAWNKRLETLNAVLGSKLQGDMQIIAVPASKIPAGSSQNYIDAIMAYWQSPELGRDTASKNSIVVALGVENGTVSWSKAATGMPGGNELLLQKLSSLTGTVFDRDVLIGKISEVKAGSAPSVSGGAISDLTLTGVTKFDRACMECKDKGESETDGFSYLRGDVKPSTGAMVAAGIVSMILSLGLWVLLYQIELALVPVLGIAVRFVDRLFGDNPA